jgi:hypothetical protein
LVSRRTPIASPMIRSVRSRYSGMATRLRGPQRPSWFLRAKNEERMNGLAGAPEATTSAHAPDLPGTCTLEEGSDLLPMRSGVPTTRRNIVCA